MSMVEAGGNFLRKTWVLYITGTSSGEFVEEERKNITCILSVILDVTVSTLSKSEDRLIIGHVDSCV